MNLLDQLNNGFCYRLVITLLHFLWQASAIALLAGSAGLLLRRSVSPVRYWLFLAALMMMAACPVATFPFVHSPAAVQPSSQPPRLAENSDQVIAKISEEGSDILPGRAPDASVSGPLRLPARPAEKEGAPAAHTSPVAPAHQDGDYWKTLTPIVMVCYLLGVMLLLARLLVGLHGGRRLRQASEPVTDAGLLGVLGARAEALGLRFTPAIAYCQRVAVPIVVGVLRPTILLPLAVTSGLSMGQVEAILTHELAHIRRYDQLVNLLQRLIETFLFYHPAVWYVSRRIRVERENCCDDIAVAAGAERLAYAQSLFDLAQASLARPMGRTCQAAVAVGAVDRPSHLRRRIRRLVGGPEEGICLTRSWPLAVLTVAATAAIIMIVSCGSGRQEVAQRATDKPAAHPARLPANGPTTRRADSSGQAVEKVPGGRLKVTGMEKDHTSGWKCTFLPDKPGAKETLVMEFFPAMSSAIELLASADGKYLAVWSECEACYSLAIMDLPVLLKDHKDKELASVGTWPGTIQMDKWDGDKLLVQSDELLTHPPGDEEYAIVFSTLQRFSLDAASGQITPLSPDAKDPVGFFTRQLLTAKNDDLWHAAVALRRLRAVQMIPQIRQALAARKDANDKACIQKTLDFLTSPAATEPKDDSSVATRLFALDRGIPIQVQAWHKPAKPVFKEPFKAIEAKEVRFAVTDGKLAAKVGLELVSWPKEKYFIRLELLDLDEKVIASPKGMIESCGLMDIRGLAIPFRDERTFEVVLGKWSTLASARSFRLIVGLVDSDAAAPAPAAAPAASSTPQLGSGQASSGQAPSAATESHLPGNGPFWQEEAKVLATRIESVDLAGAGLKDALAFLAKAAKVEIAVNWAALKPLALNEGTAITVKKKDVPLEEALRSILESAAGPNVLGYVLDGGVITVSTQAELSHKTITRAYDVSDVNVPSLKADLPTFAVWSPSDQAAQDNGDEATRAEAQQIVKLIETNVAPGSWKGPGAAASIRILHGQLVVTQTADNQRAIVALIERLRASRPSQVVLEARFLTLPAKRADEFNQWLEKEFKVRLKGANAAVVLSDAQARSLLDKAQASFETRMLTAPKLTQYDGRLAYVSVGTEQAMILPRIDKSNKNVLVMTLFQGTMLCERATVCPDRKSVSVELRAMVSSLASGGKNPVVSTGRLQTTASVPDRSVLLVCMAPQETGKVRGVKETSAPGGEKTYEVVSDPVDAKAKLKEPVYLLLRAEIIDRQTAPVPATGPTQSATRPASSTGSGPEDVASLIGSLKQREADAIAKLTAHGDDAVAGLLAELKREGQSYRFQHDSVRVLAAIGTAPAMEALLQLAQGSLGEPKPSLQEWAARQFAASLKDKRQASQLLECAEPSVQSVGLEAIAGQSLDKKVLHQVAELAVGERFPNVWRAMEALAACPDESTLSSRLDAIGSAIMTAEKSPLAQDLAATLPGVKRTNLQETWQTAVRVMSEVRASSAIMADFARRTDGSAGACAWVAMGFRHDSAAIDPICQVAKNDKLPGLRELAIYALAEVGGEAQLPLLRKLVQVDQKTTGNQQTQVGSVQQAASEAMKKLESRLQEKHP